MPRQAGYFEWDDADLTPGQKAGGGWSQNLYDEDGFLQGHARFISDDSLDPDDDVPSTSYIPTDQRSESDGNFELAIAAAVAALAATGAVHAAPHVKRWWAQSAQPFVTAQAEKIASLFRHPTRRSATMAQGPLMASCGPTWNFLRPSTAQRCPVPRPRLVSSPP